MKELFAFDLVLKVLLNFLSLCYYSTTMELELFSEKAAGKLVKTPQGYRAFLLGGLPETIPYDDELAFALSDADTQLGTLRGMGETLPNPELLIVPYTRREAVLSSKIEGTQTSLSELFIFEAGQPDKTRGDVREVWNYLRTMEYGLRRLKTLPLSTRLVQELHGKLMRGVRGEEFPPGEFKKRQNWIGPHGTPLEKATFVPAPPLEVPRLMGEWERFVHAENKIPPLVKAAILHYGFEVIHPFPDGNGRVGRLLITLFLCEKGHLPKPLLYLSAYLERNQKAYYNSLLQVSTEGRWRDWLLFFLRGVAEQARDAVDCSQRILALREAWRERLHRRQRASAKLFLLLDHVFRSPVLTIPTAMRELKVSSPGARHLLLQLVDAGVLVEGKARVHRRRMFFAKKLMQTIEAR